MKKYDALVPPVLLIVSLVLSACGPGMAGSRLERSAPSPAGEADIPELVAGNTAFAIDLYQAARTPDANLVFSPYSISLAFAMAFGGARGETAIQMADSLHFSLPQERFHAALNALDLDLAGRPDETEWVEQDDRFNLQIANAVWGQEDWSFRPEYLDLLALQYGAGVRLVDFSGAPETARQQINEWVSAQTRRRIRDIVPPGAIGSDTRMVLANAIYFKASWSTEFDPDLTSDGLFHLPDGSLVPVPMMSHGSATPLAYGSGDDWQAVSLPYRGGLTEMLVIVPDEGTFPGFSAQFNTDQYEQVIASLQYASVQLAVPKFSFETPLGLSSLMAALGMPDAFDPAAADFSGIDGTRLLFISDALHKAFIAVDEQGTEAAAATVLIMEVTSAPEQGVILTIDRPFLFFIRDVPSGTVLFMGQVLDPR